MPLSWASKHGRAMEFVAGGLMFWTVIVNPVAKGLMTPGHDKMKDSFSALLLS